MESGRNFLRAADDVTANVEIGELFAEETHGEVRG
jgi:hypothetical protein